MTAHDIAYIAGFYGFYIAVAMFLVLSWYVSFIGMRAVAPSRGTPFHVVLSVLVWGVFLWGLLIILIKATMG